MLEEKSIFEGVSNGKIFSHFFWFFLLVIVNHIVNGALHVHKLMRRSIT